MKIGTETGSLVNHLYSRMTKGQPLPTVGMGATYLSWTDRDACTVVDVRTVGKAKRLYITVRNDQAKVVNGPLEYGQEAQYEFTPSKPGHGMETTFRLDAEGKWEAVWFNEETKRWIKNKHGGLILGRRESYRDPHF